MEAHSFVSKARTAFHSATAKAERVFTDFKSDRSDSEKHSPTEPRNLVDDVSWSKCNKEGKHLRWKPASIGTRRDWQDRFKNIKIGKRGVDDHIEKADNSTMAVSFYDENLYILNMKNDAEAKGSQISSVLERLLAMSPDTIPSTSVVKQLAVAIDAGTKFKSMKDVFVSSSGGSSPISERASLSLAAVKSLVLRDKEDKLASELGDNEKVSRLIQLIFDAEGNFLRRNIGSKVAVGLPRDIHGAPPGCFLVKLSEVIGNLKTLKKMALLWCKIVDELRKLWSEELYIPGIPLDEIPDLNSCLLYQQFQVINCCISRKKRRVLAMESLTSVMNNPNSCSEELASSDDEVTLNRELYARINSRELVLRLGADRIADNLTLLETGEPIYSPITQEGPLLTEDLVKETEEFVLRTGSVGAGCSQLLSDMQAFKAANPGCILEDFVRWHSPPDWTENDSSDEPKDCICGSNSSSTRGQLSTRMQKEGNLWRELWDTAKPIPAIKQSPIFDEDLAVEGILNDLEDIPPSELFEQLFIGLLGMGFVMAEEKLCCNKDLSKLFYDCKDYVVVTCQRSGWSKKVDDLCMVYETVESMLLNPDEALSTLKQTEEAAGMGEKKRRFWRLGLNFGSKDKSLKSLSPKEEKTLEENTTRQPFSNFFDAKSSVFSKRPPRPENASPQADKPPFQEENEWTIV